MTTHETVTNDTLRQSREERLIESKGVLEVAHLAIEAALQSYDETFEHSATGIKEALEGAVIIVSSGAAFAKMSDHPHGRIWCSVATPLPLDTELTLSEVAVSKRYPRSLPNSTPAITATATQRGESGYDTYYKFWLNNAVWSFKPEASS